MKKRWMAIIAVLMFAFGVWYFADGAVGTSGEAGKIQPDIQKRLELLEYALVSQNPGGIADTWARGVMTRNGALQYAVFCDNLRVKYKADYEGLGWWTGTSSPWIDGYEVSPGEHQADGTWKFVIKFHYTDSTKASYSSISRITIAPKRISGSPLPEHGSENQWCVVRIDVLQHLLKD